MYIYVSSWYLHVYLIDFYILYIFLYVDEWTNQRRSNDHEKHAPHGSVCVRLLQPENQQTDVTARRRETDKGKTAPGLLMQSFIYMYFVTPHMVILDSIISRHLLIFKPCDCQLGSRPPWTTWTVGILIHSFFNTTCRIKKP